MTIIHCQKCGWKGEDACPDCHQEIPRVPPVLIHCGKCGYEGPLALHTCNEATVLIPTCKDCGKMLVGIMQKCLTVGGIGGDGAISTQPETLSYATSWLCPDTVTAMEPVWIRVEGRRFTPGPSAQAQKSPG